MIVRALDSLNDWTFGQGRNNYKIDIKALEQNIQTRLSSFLNDCFFDVQAGIDWFNLLGGKNQLALNLAVSATILNTPYVLSLTQLSINLSRTRNLSIRYSVKTTFGLVSANLNLATVSGQGFIRTEDGQILVTQSGESIVI